LQSSAPLFSFRAVISRCGYRYRLRSAAVLSAIFPRAADLNSIGRAGNAHGAAGLLGMLTTVASGVPCALMTLLAAKVLHRTALAPVFLIVWIGVCVGADVYLFRLATAVFERRKENLAMVE
jgi:hypothetical protein